MASLDVVESAHEATFLRRPLERSVSRDPDCSGPAAGAIVEPTMHVFLETDRLLLRRFTAADVHNLVELDSDPAVMRFLTNGRPTPREVIERDTVPRIISGYARLRGLGRMAAIQSSSDTFIGWIGFDPAEDGRPDDEIELGYRLRRSAWVEATPPRARGR